MGRFFGLLWKPGKLNFSGTDAYGDLVSEEVDAFCPTRLGRFFGCRVCLSYPVLPWRRTKRARRITSISCE